jgi:hypothetical protein
MMHEQYEGMPTKSSEDAYMDDDDARGGRKKPRGLILVFASANDSVTMMHP